MTVSSGRQRVQTDEIKNLKVFLPSIEEQRGIADALSSLDDKIDLLRHQNRTLEDMAQCLFRKWFYRRRLQILGTKTFGHNSRLFKWFSLPKISTRR